MTEAAKTRRAKVMLMTDGSKSLMVALTDLRGQYVSKAPPGRGWLGHETYM